MDVVVVFVVVVVETLSPFDVVADSRQAALYGGRMTASRLFHVGQVTSEAVEQLHRYCIYVSK